ncbi:MAG TPA: tryptophan synthase subunit alpha [Trichormus sp.]|jgi:tryptophan synthase alpha chain
MSQRYEQRFAELTQRKQKAFVPFILLGWPDKAVCLESVKTMIVSGASALELGLAFSDPVADGPVIQRAAHETLASGFKVEDGFNLLQEIRAVDAAIPIGLLVYYNLVLAYGVEQFFQQCRNVGVDGVLIADLPVENAPEVLPFAKQNEIALIYLISPVTTEERLELICQNAGGFLYLVSRLGVTGTKERDEQIDSHLSALIAGVKQRSKVPVCAGFGVSKPEHAETMLSLGADGVITGSRVIEIIRSQTGAAAQKQLDSFCREMLDVCTKFSAAYR